MGFLKFGTRCLIGGTLTIMILFKLFGLGDDKDYKSEHDHFTRNKFSWIPEHKSDNPLSEFIKQGEMKMI